MHLDARAPNDYRYGIGYYVRRPSKETSKGSLFHIVKLEGPPVYDYHLLDTATKARVPLLDFFRALMMCYAKTQIVLEATNVIFESALAKTMAKFLEVDEPKAPRVSMRGLLADLLHVCSHLPENLGWMSLKAVDLDRFITLMRAPEDATSHSFENFIDQLLHPGEELACFALPEIEPLPVQPMVVRPQDLVDLPKEICHSIYDICGEAHTEKPSICTDSAAITKGRFLTWNIDIDGLTRVRMYSSIGYIHPTLQLTALTSAMTETPTSLSDKFVQWPMMSLHTIALISNAETTLRDHQGRSRALAAVPRQTISWI